MICGLSLRDESSLAVGDESGQQRFKPVDKDFLNYFIGGGTKANGAEAFNFRRVGTFRNQADESVIPVKGNGLILES